MVILNSHIQPVKEMLHHLPYTTTHLPGVGGEIKAAPEHFQVEEILPYAPCGEGEHVFVTLRRAGWNTADVAAALARCFDLKSMEVGWGGRKDKQAVTTQTFSLHLPMAMPMDRIETALTGLPFTILSVQRHRNKLKTGHVARNRFRILITQTPPDAIETATAIAEAIRRNGIPNFYGEQRFGIEKANIDRAMQLVERQRPARGKQEAFLVSVLQSALFNIWLTERIGRNQYHQILAGDVAQKTDTGGLFVVDDVDEAMERFGRGAIVYTGPIFGPKMMAAGHPAAEFEAQVLTRFDLDLDTFKRLKAPGARRQAVLRVDDLTLRSEQNGLELAFTLPPGAYATMITREFMRPAG